jgi:hypothetical protein
MGLFEDYKSKRILQRLSEEQLYAIIHEELEQGIKRQGLWAKAIADSSGDERNAMANYIKLRFQSLQDELDLITKTAAANTETVRPRAQKKVSQEVKQSSANNTSSSQPQATATDSTLDLGVLMLFLLVAAIIGLFIYFALPSLFSNLGPSGSSIHVIGALILVGAAYLIFRNL